MTNVSGWSFDLFGQHMTAHLVMPKSMYAHSEDTLSLSNCSWMFIMLFVRIARSSAYANVVIVFGDV